MGKTRKSLRESMCRQTGTNSLLLTFHSKLVNKTRNETLNDNFVPAVPNDNEKLKKDNISFSPLKKKLEPKN